MKRILITLAAALAVVSMHAQNYMISFSGAGGGAEITAILVENLTKGTSLTMSGSDILHLSGTIGINELPASSINKVNIHPNPVNGFCTFDFETETNGQVNVGLYDLTGKLVMGQRDILAAGSHSYRLTGIGSGIYLLKITSGNYSFTSKIVSQNKSMLKAGMEYVSSHEGKSNTRTINRKVADETIVMGYTVGDVVHATATAAAAGYPYGYVVTVVVDPEDELDVVFDFFPCYDKDGFSYPVTKIGEQMWMKESLRSTKFNDGSDIPKVTDATEWARQGLSAYCWYDNDSTKYAETYGALYNWYTVKSDKLCPAGWHVPDSDEWASLIESLGGNTVAGGKLKEIGFDHWADPNTGATNQVGFTALPAGRRDLMGHFDAVGNTGYWWTSSKVGDGSAKYIIIIASAKYAFEGTDNQTLGMSVRCIKD